MRKVAVVLLLLLVSSTPAHSAPAAKPSLRIVDMTPVTVAGRGFRPNEKVRLLGTSGTVAAKVARAGPGGRFVARLDLRAVPCRGLVIQALGARGSRASISVDATDCAPSFEPN